MSYQTIRKRTGKTVFETGWYGIFPVSFHPYTPMCETITSVGADLGSANHWGCTAWWCPLRRRERSTTLGQTVRDLGAGVVPSLRDTALWPGRSAMAYGHLPPRWNLELAP
jgi:hypothetical protein